MVTEGGCSISPPAEILTGLMDPLQRNRAAGRPDIGTTGRVIMEFRLSTRGRVTPTAGQV
jgi:hypothetical protein